MEFSVIVPVFKVESFLPECIDSILAQTCTDYEIILVDDGSPDRCPIICDSFASRNKRIKVVHKKNGGLISARREGLNVASGEYVVYVDGDDALKPNHLELFHNKIIELNHPEILGCCFCYYYDGLVEKYDIQNNWGFFDGERLLKLKNNLIFQSKSFSFNTLPSLCLKCIKKTLLINAYSNLPDSITFGEDAAVVYPLVISSSSFYQSNECTYLYRVNNNSMTNSFNPSFLESSAILMSHLNKKLFVNELISVEQKHLYYSYLCLNFISNLFLDKKKQLRFKKNRLNDFLKIDEMYSSIKKVKVSGFNNKLILFLTRIKSCFLLNCLFSIVRVHNERIIKKKQKYAR